MGMHSPIPMEPYASGAFNLLPIELNKAIALELDTDADIASYAQVCRATTWAVHADNKSFWRTRFRGKYDFNGGRTNEQLHKLYRDRTKLLKIGNNHNFYRSNHGDEKKAVRVLRDLIVESFQGGISDEEVDGAFCNNQQVLLDFVLGSKLLLQNRRESSKDLEKDSKAINPTLLAVKIICSQFLFTQGNIDQTVLAFEESQHAVYLATNKAPIYKGPGLVDVNLAWVLHCMNFFRHHMTNVEAASLFDVFQNLDDTQKPSVWREPLKKGTHPLGKYWKGTYAYLEKAESNRLRRAPAGEIGDEFFIDKNVEDGKIQSLKLDFLTGDRKPSKWPIEFEEILHSLRYTNLPRRRAQSRANPKDGAEDTNMGNIQFKGTGVDLGDGFNTTGWLNPLPAQCGIPGWQRITFMKHFDSLDNIEDDNLWAYEGVVLPGGRIILGRWWFANIVEGIDLNDDYNGPFILWAVDENEDFDPVLDGATADGDGAE